MAEKINSEPGAIGAIRKIIRVLERRLRFKLFGIFILMLVSAFLEMLNIGLLLPLMQVFLKPDTTTNLLFLDEVIAIIQEQSAFSLFSIIAFLLIFIFTIKNIFIGLVVYLQSHTIAMIQGKMTSMLLTAFVRKPYEKHLSMNSANTVYDVTNTAPSLIAGILQPFMAILMEVFIAVGAGAALFIIAPKVAALSMGMVTLLLALFYIVFRKRLHSLGIERRDANRAIARWSHFSLGATKENVVLGRTNYFLDYIILKTREVARISAMLQVIGQMPRIYGEVVIVFTMIVAFAVIISEYGSVNDAITILAVFAVAAFRVFPSANRVVYNASAINQYIGPLDAIYPELYAAYRENIEPVSTITTKEISFNQNIYLNHIYYRYPGKKDWTIRDAEMSIEKGQQVAFVGPTGAGKSTLVDIILGLLPPTEGRLLVDGVSFYDNPSSWVGKVGYVPQSIFLLDDTLTNNISFGIPTSALDQRRVQEAVKLARLEAFIDELDEGLDTIIGERGVRLSGGQRQRVGVARALYHDPDILVFDEATSALDSETEKEITDTLGNIGGNRTVIIIAHRLSTIRNCDVIAYVERGRICQIGSFNELLSGHEGFRRMVDLNKFDADPYELR